MHSEVFDTNTYYIFGFIVGVKLLEEFDFAG